ncbi:MAG: hypothetical protein LAP85_17985 [Acidobacteriia bacterium]|nr:hypothetical protein [Terriglobia bacterium]
MRQTSKAVVAFLFLTLAVHPEAGAAKTNTAPRPNNLFICGTSVQRQRDVLVRSRYRDSLLRRHPERGRLLLQAQSPTLQPDSGNVALIEDDGTLTTQINFFDLAGKSILFVPVAASPSSYQVSVQSKAFAPGTGTQIILGDDDSTPVTLSAGFSFFGKSYSSVNLNSDGNLTFDQADVASTARDLGRFAWGPPRIGPLFTDLDPSDRSALVSYRTETDGTIFVWQNVPNWNTRSYNNFSVKLFNNGNIEFIFGTRVDSAEAIVGISPGASLEGVTAVDFSTTTPTENLVGTVAEVFTTSVQLMETAMARKFFLNHPDEFDQLVMFLTFPFDLQGAFSYELNVNNDVQGIGLDPVNDSSDYGSGGRLKSFVMMGDLGEFPADPNLEFMRTYNSMQVVAHEVAHRWLSFPALWEGPSAPYTTSLLRPYPDLAHWSFFFNADSSLMEGNRIIDQGAALGSQRFITSEVTNKFSDLDLYLMGFEDSQDVSPMFYVKNPIPATNSLPSHSPTVFGGTRFDFTIDNIVAANGVRTPSVFQAQKVHRIAFVLVSNSTHPATPEQIAKVQNIHDAFVSYFNQLTHGQAWAVTNLQSSPGTTPSDIYFPYFQGDGTRYTGFALANWGPAPADILFNSFDNTGANTSAPINPRMVTIPPGGQIAMLGEQIHGLSLSGTPRNGWIQAGSSSSQITGFFLEGDIAETFLDGAVAGNTTSTSLFFTRAHGTTGSLRNLIDVVNPNEAPANFSLKLIDQNGQQQGTAVQRVLNSHGRLADDLSSLFPGTDPAFAGYVTVSSDVGVIGYEAFEGSSSVFSLPAQPASSATTLYSAQFASGPAGTIRYFTDLNVINTSSAVRQVQVSLIGNDGRLVSNITNPVLYTLQPGSQRLMRGEDVFHLQDASAAASITEGTLVVTADGAGVIGDVTFGDPLAGRFMAALPLDGTPRANMILSQVAQGSQATGTGYFTGVAMYNPNPKDVSVTVDIYSEQGQPTGQVTIPMKPGERLARTLPQLVPGFTQMRGYIRMAASGGPIVAFGLFGEASSVQFLAAIPPQAIIQ